MTAAGCGNGSLEFRVLMRALGKGSTLRGKWIPWGKPALSALDRNTLEHKAFSCQPCRTQKSHGFQPWEVMYSVQFSSVAQSCLTFCDPMNHSTPGLPVHHQLPEFTQTHVHQVGDAIQPSHPLSSPSPPALNLSQHQGLFR